MTSLSNGPMPLEHGDLNRQSMQQGLHGQPSQSNLKGSVGGSIGTEFFKLFGGGQKNVTRDGQPAKRRGPKPDSRPALTRRQELNRQAQRTHRERKEQYMRALETEVSRLREAYTQEISAANLAVHQHREMIASLTDENSLLKEVLAAHNIDYGAELERRKAERPTPRFQSSPFAAGGSVGSQTAGVPSSSGNTYYTTPPTTVSAELSPRLNGVDQADFSPTQELGSSNQAIPIVPCDALAVIDRRPPVQGGGIFEDDPQLQIDFILTLESPCRDHTDYLCRRSITEAEDEDMPFSGHALMATCPPPSYIAATTDEQVYPHKTYDLPHANLTTLLNLSRQLVYRKLTRDDVKLIMETLETKVRCYGFGAVMEDFELMDCFSSVLGSKIDRGFSQAADEMLYS